MRSEIRGNKAVGGGGINVGGFTCDVAIQDSVFAHNVVDSANFHSRDIYVEDNHHVRLANSVFEYSMADNATAAIIYQIYSDHHSTASSEPLRIWNLTFLDGTDPAEEHLIRNFSSIVIKQIASVTLLGQSDSPDIFDTPFASSK